MASGLNRQSARAYSYLKALVVVPATAVLWSSLMARMVKCIKLGCEAEALDFPPYRGELGKRIFDNVSKEAWQQWLEHQMENHFFGSGADVASGYVPPQQK